MIKYISTRGGGTPKNFTDVLLSGMAPDGGLYVPTQWPQIDSSTMTGMAYTDIAYHVMKPFVGDDIPDDDLRAMIVSVYGKNFTHAAVAPLVQLGPSTWVLELFHGPTIAFKDYALQMLGALFNHVLTKKKQRVTIVGATSGDTGSAAIEGCKNSKNIDIFILHPKGRTSDVQRKQMTTILSPNVHNIAVEGNFDDCQNAVKAMFADEKFRDDIHLSAVNSINWARIMAQIVYYMAACAALGGSKARKISFAIPTGNFGNVYAAYCAKKMGAPIDKLIIGSNRNDILTRFFETGKMMAGSVEPSISPSMDIQVSSNFERFLFDVCDRDGTQVTQYMNDFKQKGSFKISDDKMAIARDIFDARRCSDAQTTIMMAECYKETGYVIDPHTAVGLFAAWSVEKDPTHPLVTLACAHPAKFPDAVKQACGIHPPLPAHLSDLFEREEKFDVLPNDLEILKKFIKEKAA